MNIKISGYHADLKESDLKQLIKCFSISPVKAVGTLGGRAAILQTKINGLGPVIIKYYQRGGLIRHWNRHWYLNTGHRRIRSRIEYEMLLKVRTLGINAPMPIAYAFTSGYFYRAFLVLEQITNLITLADLCRQKPVQAGAAMISAVQQTKSLIKNKIWHVDLHPGNIGVSHQRVYLLDFDKGQYFKGSTNCLKQKYIQRWERAIQKYDLPSWLADYFTIEED